MVSNFGWWAYRRQVILDQRVSPKMEDAAGNLLGRSWFTCKQESIESVFAYSIDDVRANSDIVHTERQDVQLHLDYPCSEVLWPDKPSVNEANRFYQVAYGVARKTISTWLRSGIGVLTEAYINLVGLVSSASCFS